MNPVIDEPATVTIDRRDPVPPPTRRRLDGWRAAIGLLALSAVPIAAGTARLVQLASGAAVTEENRRFVESPAPVVIHVLGAIVFCVAGALQLVAPLRRRHPGWHRRAGQVVVPAGLAVAVTGLWMTHRYELPPTDGHLLGAFRDVIGVAMVASLVLGAWTLRARRFRDHGAWMLRAYALGLGAGTQVLTTIVWLVAFGTPTTVQRAWVMGAGWAINIGVAEWVLHRRRVGVRPRPRPGPGGAGRGRRGPWPGWR